MKICAQCQSPFEVTDADRAFYKKMDVPEPSLCPDCRMQRRYAVRNERNLYRRHCDLCEREIISMYSGEKPFPVYCPECWWGNKWEETDYGKEFDFNRPFFDQFRELRNTVPHVSLARVNSENCDYCNFLGDCKNCYLIFGSVYSENCLYGSPYYSKNCIDNLVIRECEHCYECVDSRKLYHCLYCQDCYESSDLIFCYDMKGCSECIACAGLRNKKYHVGNKAYKKEEYEKIKVKINLSDNEQKEGIKKQLEQIKLNIPHHYMPNNNTENVSGTHIYNSKNTHQSFYTDRCEDCGYCAQVVDLKDCYDCSYTEENELCYEYLGNYGAKNTLFSTLSRDTYSVYYSEYCMNGKYLFGCSGIRNKEYCILNKQYSKDDYKKLIPKIIEHMRKTKEWGEFFPISHSPFDYNESVAQEYFPLAKEEAVRNGYSWKDTNQKNNQTQKEKTQRKTKEVKDSVTNNILFCKKCDKNYKITSQELNFYRNMNLPVPLNCPDCRHKERLALRNPSHIYDRRCANCSAEIQTTYSPDRPEMVYCETCYLKEVY